MIAPEYNINAWSDEYKIDGRDFATVSASITFYEDKQQCLLFNEKTGNIDINETDIKSFGGVSMELYYFDAKARDAYRRKFPGAKIDGIKIYRDGVITTPFAEQEDASDKKRDILGIDKRLWVSLFDKISTRELIGIVNISKDGNPNIIDATNRQDFTSTPEYIELKAFIILQLEALEPLKDIAMQAWHGIETAAKNQHDIEEEHTRHENMYLRIMSRQEDAINVAHAVKTATGKILRMARFFQQHFPNELLNDYFKLYANQIYAEMQSLERATDELFDYSKINLPFTDVDLKQLIEYLLNSYSDEFESEGIKLEMLIEDNLVLNCNEMFFYDIVQNLTNNAIKAMKNSEIKTYRCTIKAHDDKLVMDFSDTGCGIPIEKREWVFGIYNTTTAEQGGGGIGLYAVRMRVQALKGTVAIKDSEFAPLGTTVHIELPFKK